MAAPGRRAGFARGPLRGGAAGARRYYRITAPGTRSLDQSLTYYRALIPLGRRQEQT
jgi:hypothetical protein